ncbi:disulfide bond formation protein B [Arsenophonus sp. ENCA]|uniref:disulfide bond formation protein DsbB n=1 Tax=Arsenophonus sp. ENCA TaxID=1987579 RepID=UPI000BD36692|nr:disulfide bond formation protein DsbB [Arsenophonus sp. ENCA]PAV09254.1 disulfide bond formation protein B [Arsenophonus sp. ENCA]
MFKFFYSYSQTRKAWLLVATSACMLEIIALYFQHGMGLRPCVLCIYERIAIFAILAAGLIAAMAPKSAFRLVALILWLYSSWEGLKLTFEHTRLQLYPSPFDSCDFVVNFPLWLPLNRWLPTVFEAYGDCSQKQWSFLNIEMPVWLLIIFIAYFLVAIIALLSQFLWFKKIVIKTI